MEEQRTRGSFAGSGETGIADAHKSLASEMGENEFLGYEQVASEATAPGHPLRRQTRAEAPGGPGG